MRSLITTGLLFALSPFAHAGGYAVTVSPRFVLGTSIRVEQQEAGGPARWAEIGLTALPHPSDTEVIWPRAHVKFGADYGPDLHDGGTPYYGPRIGFALWNTPTGAEWEVLAGVTYGQKFGKSFRAQVGGGIALHAFSYPGGGMTIYPLPHMELRFGKGRRATDTLD